MSVPAGGSVLFLTPGWSTTAEIEVGVGTFTAAPTTGVLTFVADLGFTGPGGVELLITDAAGQETGATWTVTVTAPPAPAPTARVTRGLGTAVQSTTVAVPAGGSVTLLIPAGPATTLTVAGEGTYTANATTGVLTFTPKPGFHGAATPAVFEITDAYHHTGSATFTPTVTAAPQPVPPAAGLRVAALTVVGLRAARVAVTCVVSTGRLTGCSVGLLAHVDGHTVILGSARRTVSAASRRVTVVVSLTRQGRVLAARVGGVTVTAVAALRVPGPAPVVVTTHRTRIVTAVTVDPRPLHFAPASATLTPTDRAEVTALRHELSGVRVVVCAGYTDTAGDHPPTAVSASPARLRPAGS